MSGPVSVADLPENAPKPGDVLASKYRVESVLGVGGMGIVLLVRHIDLGQNMAIKLMMPGVIHDDQAAARFVREARAAAAIQSEHVVRIFDVGTFDSGLPYMVMELLRGEDLSQVLARETQLPLEVAVDYVLQASHAIAEAHARGIVHRDLKPSNLFVTTRSDGTAFVKVLDFGISKALNPEVDVPSSANLTATAAIMGSPLYMSPEQVRNAKQVDARTDIWALGVILHELLTGAPAFSADTLPGICAAITADDPPPLRTLREDAPVELETVLIKCLEKNVAKRYQSTKELMTALRPFAGSTARLEPTSVPAALTMREASSGPPPPPDGESESRRNRGGNPVARAGAPRSAHKARSNPKVVHVEGGPRSSGKMQGATSLATSTATVSWRQGGPGGEPGKGRKITMLAGGALLGAALLGGFVWLRKAPAETGADISGAAAPASRRSFVLFIDSAPAGAEIWEGESALGQTPMQISIDNESARKNPRRFVMRRAGFQPYSIVQGPSEENVRINAPLSGAPAESAVAAPPAVPVPPGVAPVTTTAPPNAPAVKEHGSAAPAKGTKGAVSRVEPTAPAPSPAAATPPPSAATPPPPPSDIRLQR